MLIQLVWFHRRVSAELCTSEWLAFLKLCN
jgi:hypothetical protein